MNMKRLLPLMLMACMALSSCGLLNLVTANQVKKRRMSMTDCFDGLIGIKGEDGKAGFINRN